MDKEIIYIPAKSIPVDKVLEVMTLALGGENEAYAKSEKLWNWKHLSSPFGPSWGYAAYDPSADIVASIRTMMYWNFESTANERILCARVVDISTHPDYRRLGLFTKLTEKALYDLKDQGVSVVYGTPKLKGKSIGGYLKLDFKMIDPWPVYIRVLRPVSFLKGIISGRRKNTRQYLPSWEMVFGGKVLRWQEFAAKFTLGDITDFLARADENRKKIAGIRIKKNFEYIKWRYGEHPNVDYGFVPLIKGDKMVGLSILRRNVRYGLLEVVISEFLFENSNRRAGRQLIREAINNINADYLITHYNKHTPELSVLKMSMFVKAPGQDIVFIIKKLTEGNLVFDNQENWNLSLGDIELF